MYQQALAIYEKLAPNSLQVATTLHNLGNVAYRSWATWRVRSSIISRRWRLKKNLPPTRCMWQARSTIWGMWLIDRGDLARAEQYYQQALAIYEKLAPNSLEVASTLNNLGNVALDRGDLAACGAVVSAGVGDF
jgi:tetratricopeptide (TPR) repeat protein